MSGVLCATQQSGEPRLHGHETQEDPLSPPQGHPRGGKMSCRENVLQNCPEGSPGKVAVRESGGPSRAAGPRRAKARQEFSAPPLTRVGGVFWGPGRAQAPPGQFPLNSPPAWFSHWSAICFPTQVSHPRNQLTEGNSVSSVRTGRTHSGTRSPGCKGVRGSVTGRGRNT